jgi:DDE superfamily endonuclease
VAAMEDVLDLYTEPYDPQRPTVNFDETSKPLIRETRKPLPTTPGRPARDDSEDERNGTRNLCMLVEPRTGWRHITGTERRTMQDFAYQRPWLVDEGDPEATVIRVVMDHLNTHKPASRYEPFVPSEARRLLKKLEFH